MIRIRNLMAALKHQLPLKRLLRNFFVTGNGWGVFSRYAHISRASGKPKVCYPSAESARRAAAGMGEKHGRHFSVYKCIYCDGYHIGKNRENKYDAAG